MKPIVPRTIAHYMLNIAWHELPVGGFRSGLQTYNNGIITYSQALKHIKTQNVKDYIKNSEVIVRKKNLKCNIG